MATSETGEEALHYREFEVLDAVGANEELWVDARRPNYEEEVRWLAFLDACYEGGEAYLRGPNLTPFLIERVDGDQAAFAEAPEDAPRPGELKLTPEYYARRQQSSRLNIVRELVDSMVAFLAGRTPSRKLPADRWLQKFVEGVDLGGNVSLTEFSTREGARRILLHGSVVAAADTPLTLAETRARLAALGIETQPDDRGFFNLTDAQRELLGRFAVPHAYYVHPANVLNGFFDKAGNFEEVLLAERRYNGETLESGKGAYETVYRHITRQAWQLLKVAQEAAGGERRLLRLDGGPNPTGFVGVTLRRLRPKSGSRAAGFEGCPGDDGFRGLSSVEDWAFIDRSLYDLLSAFGWNLKENSSTQVYISGNLGNILDPDVREKEVRKAQKAARSPMIVLGMDAKIGAIEKKFDQAGLMLEAVERLARLVFQFTGFRDKVQDSNMPESGEARMRAFQLLNAHLAEIGRLLGPMERFLIKTVHGLLGGDPESIGEEASQYPRAYDVRSIEDDLLLVEKLWGKAPEELLKQILKDISHKTFAELAPRDLDALDRAIDDWQVPGNLGDSLARLAGEASALDSGRAADRFQSGAPDADDAAAGAERKEEPPAAA